MIRPSKVYKLVNKSDQTIIAEGSAKTMRSLRKSTPGTFVGVGACRSQLGQKFNSHHSSFTLITE